MALTASGRTSPAEQVLRQVFPVSPRVCSSTRGGSAIRGGACITRTYAYLPQGHVYTTEVL